MRPAPVLLIVAALAAGFGLYLGLSEQIVTGPEGAISCGSVLNPDSRGADYYDEQDDLADQISQSQYLDDPDYAGQCEDQLESPRFPAYGLLGFGGLALLGALMTVRRGGDEQTGMRDTGMPGTH